MVCHEEQLLIVEGTSWQVAGAVRVDGALVLVSKGSKAEDVGVGWCVVEWFCRV